MYDDLFMIIHNELVVDERTRDINKSFISYLYR